MTISVHGNNSAWEFCALPFFIWLLLNIVNLLTDTLSTQQTTRHFDVNMRVFVCVCGCGGSGLRSCIRATSSPSSRQDYWHRIPLPLAEIARTQGQSTRIWELPWALLVCERVCVCQCERVRALSVYLHGYQLSINGAGFLPGAELPGSGKNMSSLLFSFSLFLSLPPSLSPVSLLHTHKHTQALSIAHTFKIN